MHLQFPHNENSYYSYHHHYKYDAGGDCRMVDQTTSGVIITSLCSGRDIGGDNTACVGGLVLVGRAGGDRSATHRCHRIVTGACFCAWHLSRYASR